MLFICLLLILCMTYLFIIDFMHYLFIIEFMYEIFMLVISNIRLGIRK